MRCTKCNLYKTSQIGTYSWVKLDGVGNPNADIMLIGEAPGANEIKYQKPFVGRSGQLLRHYLKSVGIKEDDIYISNLVRCKPPQNRTPTNSEIKLCSPYLEEELNQVKPKVLGLLGNTSTEYFTGKKGVTSLHGKELWSDKYNCWLVPLYHPSYLLRFTSKARQHKEFVQDISYLQKLVHKTHEVTKTKIHIVKNLDQLKKLSDFLSKQEYLSFDTETDGLDPLVNKILCHTFSYRTGESFFVPYEDNRFWSYEQLDDVKKELQKIYFSISKKIAQNLVFDYKFLKVNGIELNNIYFDTKLAHHLLDEEGNHSLSHLALTYTNMGMYKENVRKYMRGEIKIPIEAEGKKKYRKSTIFDAPIEEYIEYACQDTDATFRVFQKEQTLLKEQEVEQLFYKVVMPAVLVLGDMELNGIQGDKEYIKKTDVYMQKKIYDLELSMQENKKVKQYLERTNIENLNFNSPKQLQDFFFNFLNLNPVKKTDKGAFSVDQHSLEELHKKTRLKVLSDLLSYRKLQKFYSTYIKAYKKILDTSLDGRIHTNYNMTGTVTGRLSSASPNLQNIPKKHNEAKIVRKSFIPKEGYTFCECDFSQLEVRVFAHCSKDAKLIKAVKKEDIHKEIAAKIFHIIPQKITKEQRDKGKTIVFGGIIYQGGANVVVRETGCSYEEAQRLIMDFYNEFQDAEKYIEQLVKDGIQNGCVRNLFGRTRHLNGLFSTDDYIIKNAERQAVNSPIQGGAADIVYIAMKKLHDFLKDYDCKMLLNIHDAVIFEIKDEIVNSLVPKIIQVMENPVKLRVPLKVKAEVGKNLAEMQEFSIDF